MYFFERLWGIEYLYFSQFGDTRVKAIVETSHVLKRSSFSPKRVSRHCNGNGKGEAGEDCQIPSPRDKPATHGRTICFSLADAVISYSYQLTLIPTTGPFLYLLARQCHIKRLSFSTMAGVRVCS